MRVSQLLLAVFFFSSASAAPSGENKDGCCSEKKVGSILYKLVEDDAEKTKSYGCLNGCIYNADEDPVDKFCFKSGSLPVKCEDGEDGFHWCYEGKCGPSHWAEEFPICNGTSQSPIDITYNAASSGAVTQPSPLTFTGYEKIRIETLGNSEEHILEAPTTKRPGDRLEKGSVKNNGHTAQLDVIATLEGDVGVLSGGPLNGDYQILQLHFHWGSDDTKGSEHTLNGKMFPMELHIVHKKVGEPEFLSAKEGLAVTGFFFEVTAADNPAIEPLVEKLKNIIDPESKFDMSGSSFRIDELIGPVISPLTEYGNYAGSLTTPGCMEIVNWINFIKPIEISASQLALFRTLQDSKDKDIVDNFRPVQPLNERPYTFYKN